MHNYNIYSEKFKKIRTTLRFHTIALFMGVLLTCTILSSANINAQESGEVAAKRAQIESMKANLESAEEELAKMEDIGKTFWQQLDKSLSFGYSLNKGNTDNMMLSWNAKVAGEANGWVVDSGLGQLYSERNEETDGDTTRAHLRLAKTISERFYVGFDTSYLRDDIASIDYRVSVGPVFGVFLVKNDLVKWDVYVSPSYAFDKVGGVEESYFAPKIGENFSITLENGVKFYSKFIYQFSIDDTDKFFIDAEAGIEAPISKRISLSVAVIDHYENQPALGRDENDVGVIASAILNF